MYPLACGNSDPAPFMRWAGSPLLRRHYEVVDFSDPARAWFGVALYGGNYRIFRHSDLFSNALIGPAAATQFKNGAGAFFDAHCCRLPVAAAGGQGLAGLERHAWFVSSHVTTPVD